MSMAQVMDNPDPIEPCMLAFKKMLVIKQYIPEPGLECKVLTDNKIMES